MELNDNDRQRIEHYWKKYCEAGDDNVPNVMLKEEFIKAIEAATRYEREQQAKMPELFADQVEEAEKAIKTK